MHERLRRPDLLAPLGRRTRRGERLGPARGLDITVDHAGQTAQRRSVDAGVVKALEQHRQVRHLKIEDGRGRRLGRLFGVKLWPTLIFLKDGAEIGRLVRPNGADEIEAELRRIDPP
jgi:hypothetical protein